MRCGNVMALQIRETVFGVSHLPGAYTVLDFSGYAWVRSKITTSSVTFACAPTRFTFSHLHL